VAMVEFTLVALPLFLILFGIAEMGWLFSRYLCVTQVARQGCREVALAQSLVQARAAMTNAAVAMGLDSARLDLSDIGYRKRNTDGSWPASFDVMTANDQAVTGDQVRVIVTYTYPALVGGFILSNNARVSATTVMRREQIYEP